ncbi:methyltransferase domain-containing protein [Actinomadura nitritigenes]|uniref:methyltransferase domain-containing protein n=1 Tax=Actinomadura nitritigenes TaxID=134602 RepID=UPI003D929AB2
MRDGAGWLVPLRRSDDPERWREAVAGRDPVVTKVEFDPAVPEELRDAATGRGVNAVSSSSAPHIVREMLELLRPAPGMRVLEIGTGTGWNAALIAEIAGPHRVTSVEIAPDLAERARRNLERAGYAVRVVTGDGEAGHAGDAPYDRVIATASVNALPYAWVEQTRPGGLIVVPWGPTFHPDCPIARLEVRADGTAEGRFHVPGWFMPLRAQQSPPSAFDEAEERWAAAGRPDVGRYGVTVAPEGQTVWLDRPGNRV